RVIAQAEVGGGERRAVVRGVGREHRAVPELGLHRHDERGRFRTASVADQQSSVAKRRSGIEGNAGAAAVEYERRRRGDGALVGSRLVGIGNTQRQRQIGGELRLRRGVLRPQGEI